MSSRSLFKQGISSIRLYIERLGQNKSIPVKSIHAQPGFGESVGVLTCYLTDQFGPGLSLGLLRAYRVGTVQCRIWSFYKPSLQLLRKSATTNNPPRIHALFNNLWLALAFFTYCEEKEDVSITQSELQR